MAKAQDDGSRIPVTAETPGATPVPVRVPTEEDSHSGGRKDGARRSRAGLPRERSGPIGIASGDFATPTVRKRTITQPRGTPIGGVPMQPPPAPIVLGPPLEDSVADAAPAAPDPVALAGAPVEFPIEPATPPPLPPGGTLGATPVDLVDGVSEQGSIPPPLPTEDPFGLSVAAGELDTEAAVLAAEAAAVRALDSGPLTPPPEANVPGPTPLPLLPPDQDLPTPPPVIIADAAPLPAVPTPPPTGTPAPLEIEVDEPVAEAPPEAAPEEPVIAEAAEEALPEEPVSPPAIEGALPESPMASEGSVASSDLAHPVIETPGPALSLDVSLDADLDGADALEVEEASETDALAEPASGQAGSPRTPTPPPIPGAFVRGATPDGRAEPRPSTPHPVVETPAPVLPPAPVLSTLPVLPEALSPRPRRPKRSKPWFEEVFDEDYLRTLPFLRPDQTLREVEFIAASLSCPAGGELLDIGCGYGRHAIELVQRGYNVTGLDLSLPLLIRAADEAQRRSLSVNFVHADMREMSFENQFDGAYSMLTSFGYFDEEMNLRVAERIARALKPGGRLLLDIVNRDYVVGDLPMRVWWEGTGCVVLEEVDFNFNTSRINTHRSVVFDDGRQLEQELSIRAYSLHEIGRLLKQAGFRVTDVSGHLATRGDFFGSASRNLLISAEKRADSDA